MTVENENNSDSQSDFAQRMQRVDALVQEIQRLPDTPARAAMQNLTRTLLDLHREALKKLLELVPEQSRDGRSIVDAFAGDELVGSVLLLHDLHPWDLQTRVHHALDRAQPVIESQGGSAELLSISSQSVRLKLSKSKSCGCGSSSADLERYLEGAVRDAAPEIDSIEIESPEQTSPELVQLRVLDDAGAQVSVND